ncbi:hypothetical protein GUITHDRAFT_46429, partial [Guillardia theta CCMP2712]
VKKYFEVWNKHDKEGVGKMFADDGSLRDWEVEVKGAQNVADANGKIFQSAPGIQIEVLKIHYSAATSTASAEILVHVNDADKTVLKVVDVIEYNDAGLISSLRAYK